MRILSMTATFGKLENQTLTLEPGLNVISAPNEWGKTTWCAFIATMLYGLDTREKTTKTSLAAKEHYAPWSGASMAGRMDLYWNDRYITIERWTKGRTPMGEFRAYETDSGLQIPELTATNCGQTLLGVEKSVFMRAGFLRLADLPVTADESLRRRLNALVTTGDESGAADELAQKLKDLKNKCRYNRSGLIPQAEAQRNALQSKLNELQALRTQSEQLQQRCAEAEAQIGKLENHRVALQYAAAQADLSKVEQAHMAVETAAKAMAQAEDRCANLPSRENAVEQLHRHAQLLQEQASLLQQWNSLPPEPQPPQVPDRYQGMEPDGALAQAEADTKTYANLEQASKKDYRILYPYPAIAAVLALLGILLGNTYAWIAIIASMALIGAGLLWHCIRKRKRHRQEAAQLLARYPGILPEYWQEDAAIYAESQRQYTQMLSNALALRQGIRRQIDAVENALNDLMAGCLSRDFLLSRNEIISTHDALTEARRAYQQASTHANAMDSMIKTVTPPLFPDELTCSETETAQTLSALKFETQQLQLRLGQSQGRMDALGSENALQSQLDSVNQRIAKLELTYNALDLALQTLDKASAELQRRFAPRIAESARNLFGKLTGGRYDRLNLTQELAIHTAAAGEVAIRSAQWRSEGTTDQLYLALRLAVANELTPEAPLILDDALVRFDDTRHSIAMEILRTEATEKQVILFTCQSREHP